MQQKELKDLVENKMFWGATSISKEGYYLVKVVDINNEESTIRTARGGVRKFKTLEAVKKMLLDVGVNDWLVR